MKKIVREWLAALVLLVLVGGGIGLGFYLGGQSEVIDDTIVDEIQLEEENAPTFGVNANLYSTRTENQHGSVMLTPNGKDPVRTIGNITFGNTTQIPTDVFMTPYLERILEDGVSSWGDNIVWDEFQSRYHWYQVGLFTGGEFKGKELIVLNVECEGPCFAPLLYRFALNEMTGELTYFENESNEWEVQELKVLFENRSGTLLPELAMPERIAIPGTDKIFTRDATDLSFWGSYGYFEDYKVLFSDSEVGPLYEIEGSAVGCVYAMAPDGSITRYAYDPEFDGGMNSELNLNTGKIKYLSNYSPRRGGCGITGMCYMVESLDKNELIEVGVTNEGTKMYEVKNPDVNATTTYSKDKDLTSPAGRLAELYRVYGMSQKENAKSFSDFLADYPLLFWQDPLGRWGALVNVDYQPAAECGKPVIYLYPEKTMDVDVRVEVDEFTKTIPEHGVDGWHVRATPTGKIYNYADGKNYPYLFWEGHDKDKVEADSGFMVARDELPRFLRTSLHDLGFTRQEMKDFIEFWEPRMLDNPEPFFFINFMGTREFNTIAPLHITPAPDVLIRVFMYFDPVSVPYAVTGQRLNAVPRHGFTVFEWGGTSSRPWANE